MGERTRRKQLQAVPAPAQPDPATGDLPVPGRPPRPKLDIPGIGKLTLLTKGELQTFGGDLDVIGITQSCGHPPLVVYSKTTGALCVLCRECKCGSAVRIASDG